MAISIVIRGDYTSFQSDMAKVRAIARRDGKAISDAMNNSISMSAGATQISRLAGNLSIAARSAQGLKTNTDAAIPSIERIAKAAGITGTNFTKMAQQSMKVTVSRNLEDSMRSIQRTTGASAWEMAKLRSSIGDNIGALRTMGQAAADSFRKVANLRNAVMVGVAGYALHESAQTAMQFDTYQRSFNAISGSQAGGADEMRFAREEAERLGQDIFALADSYRGLSAAAKGSGLSQAQIREVFSSVGEASTTLGLSSEQTKYALYALQQMVSKGVVSMEELRRQLGDSLPGAFGAAARAMGVTEAELTKLVETGQLASKDFLPKFAAELRRTFGGGFEEAAEAAARQITRMTNAWTEAKGAFGAGFLDEAASGAVRLAKILERNNDSIRKAGEFVGDVISVFGRGTAVAGTFFQAGVVGFAGLVDSALAFNKAMVDIVNPFSGVSHKEAFANYTRDMRNVKQTVGELGHELRGNLAVALGQADTAAGASSKGMNTAANAADNTSGAAWNAADAYEDLAAAMALVAGMGVSVGKSMQSDMKILTDFTKQARTAATLTRDQAKHNADAAWLSLDAQRQQLIDNGEFDKALELNIALEQQASLIREIERGEIGLEKARSTRKGRKGLSEEEKALRELTKNLQEQLHFYDQLRNVMPAAGAEYDKIRQQLLALEETQYRAIGISQQYLDIWRDYSALREATDFMSGMKVAAIDYSAGLTEAKQAQDLFQVGVDGLSQALFDTVTGAKSAKEAFADMGKAIVDQLIKMMTQMYVMKPIMEWFQKSLSNMSGGGGWASQAGGMLANIGMSMFADGGAPKAAGLTQYANQVVTKPTVFPFAKGGAFGLMGEAGPEAIMPLSRDSRGRLGVHMDGGSGVQAPPAQITINIVNKLGDNVQAKAGEMKQDGKGGFSLDILVEQLEMKMAQNHQQKKSPLSNSLKRDWGMGGNEARNAYRK